MVKNYNFFVFKFLLFILLNFIFIFQIYFSFNFFFSSIIDEELIISFAIFFVFTLIIDKLIIGLQDMLKSRIDICLNVFVLVFKLLKKNLKRFKKHNQLTINFKLNLFEIILSSFFKNLTSFFNHQFSFNNYLINFRLKILGDILSSNFELRLLLKKRFLLTSYRVETEYLNLVKYVK